MSVVPSLTCVSPALSGQLVARLVSCQTFLFLLAVMNIPYCAAYCLPENNSHKLNTQKCGLTREIFNLFMDENEFECLMLREERTEWAILLEIHFTSSFSDILNR